MKSVYKFILFFIYVTAIFFFSHPISLAVVFLINLCYGWKGKVKAKKIVYNLSKVLPFVLFTWIINFFLMTWQEALMVGIKLLLVCHVTYLYSQKTNSMELACVIGKLCKPLKFLHISPEEIQMLVCITISILPVLRKQWIEIKESCQTKQAKWKVAHLKYMLSKFMISLLERAKQMDEAFLAKGVF